MKRLGYRRQRTISRIAEVNGRGIVTGEQVRLRFLPAPIDSGVVFVRTDCRGMSKIPAVAEMVTGTNRRTTLGSSPSVTLVEHVLAAIRGLRIDNCTIEIDGPEPPGGDGSSKIFVDCLLDSKPVLQSGWVSRWAVTRPIVLRQSGTLLAIYPHDSEDLKISYRLDYGLRAFIPPQNFTTKIDSDTFQRELAATRTFVLQEEALKLQEAGIGRHLSFGELVVFGASGPIDTLLRFANEPARHKVLDLVGDLALCGYDIAGHVVAYRSGHPQNVELASKVRQAILLCQSDGNSVRRAA